MACTMAIGLWFGKALLQYGPMVRNMKPALYRGTVSADHLVVSNHCLLKWPT